jgi:hypothetical protein
MVPGLTEREHRFANVRRLECLAAVRQDRTRLARSPAGSEPAVIARPRLPLGMWRRGLPSPRLLGKRIRHCRPHAHENLAGREPAPVR